MKCIYLSLICTLITGCASNTGTGIISGSSIGAATGGLIAGGKGALIGSAIGFVTGGLIGAALDEQDRRIIERSSPRTVDRMDRGDPLTINDVIKLSQNGVNDDTVISYIKNTNGSYNLSQAQVRRLQDAGVSQRVLNYMIDSGR